MIYFQAPLTGITGLNLLLAAATVAVFAVRSRKVQAAVTLAVMPLMAIMIWLAI